MTGRRFRGIVHCRAGADLWASRGDTVYRSGDEGLTWRPVVRLPLPAGRRLRGATRLGRRLFRMAVHHLRVVRGRHLVVLGFGRCFSFDLADGARLVADGPLHGRRPLVLCATDDGRLLYGEYRGNPERSPVSVWESADGGIGWRAAHTFDDVRHIHGVFADPQTGALWITTGDTDAESAIWKATPDFGTVERVIAGSQQARAISLGFTPEYVYYGTDTPLEPNHICVFDRDDPRPQVVAPVDGSVFHTAQVGADLFFTTACEPSPVNRSGRASLYRVGPDGRCTRLASWAKDPWPMKLFQYGQVLCAADQRAGPGLWVTPFATRGDQQSVCLDPNATAAEEPLTHV